MKRMKKAAVLILAACLMGCGASATQSELWKHDTAYKNWDHLKYSIFGYKKSEPEDAKKSSTQDWWGIPTDVEEPPPSK